jgi:hypothetical protein
VLTLVRRGVDIGREMIGGGVRHRDSPSDLDQRVKTATVRP